MDTSLYKLNRNAFAILSDAAAEMTAISIKAIDAAGSVKQPKLQNQLIQVGALYDQIIEHVAFNPEGTKIVGIRGEDVSTINDLLSCLKAAAGLNQLSQFPTPFTENNFTFPNNQGYLVGPPGSILVSDGTTYLPVTPTVAGQVPVYDGAGNVIWSSVVGNGLPAGGLDGQFLIKNSNNSYDVIWSTLTISQVSDITASAERINILTGVDPLIGTPELNTLLGINTSMTIQQQLDALGSPVLPHGRFWVGDALDQPVAHQPAGDVTFNDVGVFSIMPNVIFDSHINTDADIQRTKLAPGSSYRIIINDNAGVMADAPAIMPNRALISDANGIPTHSGTTATALSYISTLSSNAQDQLNTKLTVDLVSVAQGDMIQFNGISWVNFGIGGAGEVLTSDGLNAFWGSSTASGLPPGGTANQILRKIDATPFNADWDTLVMADITDVTTSASELNLLDGLTVNATQLNYSANVTGDIQFQIDQKLGLSLTHHSIWVGGPSNTAVQTSAGPNGSVLTIVSGHPTWQTPPPPGTVSGPISTTDNAIARWDGTTGVTLNNSGIIIDDTDNITGVASLSSGQIDILNQAELRLHETGSTNYVGIRSSAIMSADYTITLPDTAPAANTALTFDGTDYVWGPSGGVVAFLDLSDVDETTFVGHAGELVAVNATEDALEFIASGAVLSITGTTDRIDIGGTGANPTVDIAATYVGQTSINTLGTITVGTWNSTNIALANGGTGASLTAPVGTDRIFFYDISAGSTAFLDIGAGLSISGTTLTATGSYTDEQAQDAVGNIFSNTATVNFTYDDATPSISATVVDNSISNTKLRQSAGLSVIGRSVNSPGNVADITGTDGQVLRVSGTTLGFGSIGITGMSMNTNRMLGRTTAGTGAVEELTVENGLTLASGTLKWGGVLTGNTNISGSGSFFNLVFTNLGNYQLLANDIVMNTPTGGAINLKNNVLQTLTLGDSAGAVLNLGSDAAGDLYYRNGLGKFDRLAISAVGTRMIVGDTGLPIWSNLIVKDVNTTTYLFLPSDNGKFLRFTHVDGCTATVPASGLDTGWSILAYRAAGAGLFTFTPVSGLVQFEGPGFTIPQEENVAGIYHRGANFYVVYGAVIDAASTGITNTAANTELMKSDGINAVPSGLFVPSNGNLTLGSASINGDRVITTSTTSAGDLVLKAQRGTDYVTISRAGTGELNPYLILGTAADSDLQFHRIGTFGTFGENAAAIQIGSSQIVFTNEKWGIHGGGAAAASGWMQFLPSVGITFGVSNNSITGAVGVSSSVNGKNLSLIAGSAWASAGDGNGGNILVQSGQRRTSGLGVDGNVTIDARSGNINFTTTGQFQLKGITAASPSTMFFRADGTWAVPSGSGGSGTVTSVSGIVDRISITGTPSVNPTVDIAATYAGQSSITTLGTVTIGTWNATTIATNKGGTGLTAIGTANQILGVNNTATGLEYKTLQLGSTPQSNNLGWVLTGPNAAVLHVPDASATVRGVVTTTAQTFGGAKTFSAAPTISTMTIGSVVFIGTSGILSQNNALFFWDNNNTRLGIGTNTPSAKLHLSAHSAASGTAPIKLTSGTPLGTTEDGVFEYHTSHLYFTIGSIRYQLDQQIGGGGGITNSAANTELMLSDGINAVPSGLWSTTAGNLRMGDSALSGASRVLNVAGSATNIALYLGAKAEPVLVQNEFAVYDTSFGFTLGNEVGKSIYLTAKLTNHTLGGGDGDAANLKNFDIKASNGINSTAAGRSLNLYGGNAFGTGNLNGGNVTLTSGLKNGSGLDGNIIIDARTGILDFKASVFYLNGLAPASPTTMFFRADGTWAVPGGGGGGISNTAANAELGMSDGTNIIPSGIFMSTVGQVMSFGSSSIGGASRTFNAIGSGPDISMNFVNKGPNGQYTFALDRTSDRTFIITSDVAGSGVMLGSDNNNVKIGDSLTAFVNGLFRIVNIGPLSGGAGVQIYGQIGLSSRIQGQGADGSSVGLPFTIKGANSSGTNNNGGNLIIESGNGTGTGRAGNITIDSLTGYLILATIPTSSAGLPSGAVWSNSNVLNIVP